MKLILYCLQWLLLKLVYLALNILKILVIALAMVFLVAAFMCGLIKFRLL